MSAIVAFSEGDPWFTNSHNWSVILRRAMDAVRPADRQSFDWFLNETGLDFPSVPPADRSSVARLMLGVIEELESEHTAQAGREAQASGPLYGDLEQKLLNEFRVSINNRKSRSIPERPGYARKKNGEAVPDSSG
ncbi:hypothetical protein [Streptomyces sp. NPDC059479]|uniref:hypothetical protein n=1 Tax=Streptomyces sp. NPDC059479 TaxID=3346848 RepID=UPI0036742A78